MTIIRVQKGKENPYVQIDKRPLNDGRLTWKAKGILAYLLSKPDDWQIWVTDLVKRSKDGEHSVRMGLRELMKYGYATKRQERGTDGKYRTVEWIVYERPLGDFPQADNPHVEKPPAENHKYTNNDSTKNEGDTKKDRTKPIGEKPDPLLFSLDRKTADSKEPNYAVPSSAGGANSFADGPLDAFAVFVAGISLALLPAKTRRSWAGKLYQIAEHWSTEERPITAEIMEQAIQAVPDSDIGWKTYTSPYAGNFEMDIGPLLLGGGQTKQKGKSHATRQQIAPHAAPRRVHTPESAAPFIAAIRGDVPDL